MKSVLILPGSSPLNQELIDDFTKYFEEKGANVKSTPWPHWKTGDRQDFDVEGQSKRIKKLFDESEGKVTIIAKSLGTYMFCATLPKLDKSKIQRVILLGIPQPRPDYKTLNDLDPSLITIIQAKSDPYFSYKQLEKMVRDDLGNKDIKLIELDRKDHIYPVEDVVKVVDL